MRVPCSRFPGTTTRLLVAGGIDPTRSPGRGELPVQPTCAAKSVLEPVSLCGRRPEKRERSDGAPTSKIRTDLGKPRGSCPVRAGTGFITTPHRGWNPFSPGGNQGGPAGSARGRVPSCPEGKKDPRPHHPLGGFQTKVRSWRFAMLGIVGNIGVGVENFSRGGLRRKGLVWAEEAEGG